MKVPADLQALATGGQRVPEGLGGPAQTVLGERRAFTWFQDDDLRVWGPPDGSEVWMVSVEYPPFAGSPQEVLDALGEPALRLDTALGSVPIPGGEWVYPDRGLAVFADVEDGKVFRLNLFAPVDAGSYEAQFGTHGRERRQPER